MNTNTNTMAYMHICQSPEELLRASLLETQTVCHHPPRPKMLKYKWKSSHPDPDLSFEVPHTISQLQKSKNLLTSLLKFIACVNVAQKDGGVIQLPTLRNSLKCASCRLSICRSSVFFCPGSLVYCTNAPNLHNYGQGHFEFWKQSAFLAVPWILGEDLPRKEMFFFGHCPKR